MAAAASCSVSRKSFMLQPERGRLCTLLHLLNMRCFTARGSAVRHAEPGGPGATARCMAPMRRRPLRQQQLRRTQKRPPEPPNCSQSNHRGTAPSTPHCCLYTELCARMNSTYQSCTQSHTLATAPPTAASTICPAPYAPQVAGTLVLRPGAPTQPTAQRARSWRPRPPSLCRRAAA